MNHGLIRMKVILISVAFLYPTTIKNGSKRVCEFVLSQKEA